MRPRLAIVERLPGHTEVMGGFAALVRELGWDVHLLFNRSDSFHFVDYLAARLAIVDDHIHDWSYINDHDVEFDAILLNTSCVWLEYGIRLQHWASSKRLIVVHHLPEDIQLNPFGASLYLTPAVHRERWIFPLYGKPDAPPEIGLEAASRDALPTMVTIGALDLKDVGNVAAYMKAGGNVTHYDRHKCRFFSGDTHYTQHVGLGGVEFMKSLAAMKAPLFLWFPIVPESHYMVYRFTGALIMGVDLNCVMVMPGRFCKLYGFPADAVIAYESSVMEAECLRKLCESDEKQRQRRKRLAEWGVERWEKNLEILRGLLRV